MIFFPGLAVLRLAIVAPGLLTSHGARPHDQLGPAVGYCRAGITDITGVDHREQKRYPFRFIQADALEYLSWHGREYDLIHASPPCQAYSVTKTMKHTRAWKKQAPDLIARLRELLLVTERPWVIENVCGAPLVNPVMLCGTQFGLLVFRHRYFESPWLLLQPEHHKHVERVGRNGFCCVAGHGDTARNTVPADHRRVSAWKKAMGIDWMTQRELAESVPPAYTEWIGKQICKALEWDATA